MKPLIEILHNFSFDELVELLPNGSLEFTASIQEDSSEPTISTLSQIAYVTLGTDLILNNDLRTLLIERMTTDQLKKFFPELVASSPNVSSAHYKALKEWSKANLSIFADRMKMTDTVEALTKTDTSIDSIIKIEPTYGLYPYQKDISDEVLRYLSKGQTRLMLHLPTGAGKTRTAMNIVAQHLRENPDNLVLWLADREELCSQALDEFKKSWSALGNRTCTGYGFYSQSDVSLSGVSSGCVVAGLHKLLRLRRNDARNLKLLYSELRSKVSLVIFDEAHKAIAPEYSSLVEDFLADANFKASLIGLTATPGRTYQDDGLSDDDKALANFFGNTKISMKVRGYLSPIDYLVDNNFLAKAEFLSLKYQMSEVYGYSLQGLTDAETNKELAKIPERNKTIVSIAKNEAESGSQIIIFACSVDHARKIAVALNYLGISSASIDSQSDTAVTRRSKINRYKNGEIQVLTNFGVLTAGFDAPKTSVAIIAKPTKSLVEYLQMAGRAMRGFESGGNYACKIYTVLDEIPEFNNVSLGTAFWNDLWTETNANDK